MKSSQASKITCPNAMSAAVLATILTAEGHATVWLTDDTGPKVLTTAPLAAITAAIDTTTTAVR